MADKAYLAIDMGASSGRHVVGTIRRPKTPAGGGLPLRQRPGRDRRTSALGPARAVDATSARACGPRPPLQARPRGQRGRRYLGRRFRPAGPRRRAAGQSLSLSRQPHQRHDGEGLRHRRREEIFRHTGLQFMQFNTLYQLLAMKLAGSPLLDIAETLLMMPDLFHWLLTGVKCNEMTDASTSQFYDPVRGRLGHRAVGPLRPAHRHPRPHRAAGDRPGPPPPAAWPPRPAWRPTWSCPARTTRPAP